MSLNVVITAARPGWFAARVPASLRDAYASLELKPGRILLCESPEFARRWRRQLKGLGPSATLAREAPAIGADEPLLVISGQGFPRPGALKRLAAEVLRRNEPARWQHEGRTVAAYFPRWGKPLDAACWPETASAALKHAAGPALRQEGWLEVVDDSSARAAERVLCDDLPKSSDGYLARFDRRLSIALSRLMLRSPVTPNALTTAGLLLGLAGAWALAGSTRGLQFLGACLLWACCILDGCDGEVARLKLLCSRRGAVYDLAADEVSHIATFIAIPIGVHRRHPDISAMKPGLLLFAGFTLSSLSVWWLILRRQNVARRKIPPIIERIASRDYVYLLVLATAFGRMDWFLWAAAIGSHLFYVWMWLLAARRGPTAEGPLSLPPES